jgi:hypothetical protein
MRVKLTQRQFSEVLHLARSMAETHSDPSRRGIWAGIVRQLFMAGRQNKRDKAAACGRGR